MDPLQGVIDEYKKYLKPVDAFSDKMSYESFAKPFEKYIKGASESYKPWYEYYKAQPARQTMAGSMASQGTSRTGWGKDLAQKNIKEIYNPMYEQMDQIQNQYRQNFITPAYQRQVQRYYESPLRGFNY